MDGDGALELIIGNGREIFDLYALEDGEPVKLLAGWERNAFVILPGGEIYNTASGGAAYTVFTVFAVQGAELLPQEALVFDTGNWTLYAGAEGQGEGAVLTEAEAEAWMAARAGAQTWDVETLHEADPLS